MNARVFEDARVCYDNLNKFRRSARRCHLYTYGDQWGDAIFANGKWQTESNYLREQGKVPLKNNMIRQLVKSVLGKRQVGAYFDIALYKKLGEKALTSVLGDHVHQAPPLRSC